MSEKIGRHKGAVETLLHEKKELSRILQIVNSQLERHLQELEDAGVDTDAFIDSLLEEEGSRKEERTQNSERNQRSKDGRSSNQGRDSRDSRGRNRNSSSQSHNSDSRGGSSGSDRDFSPSR